MSYKKVRADYEKLKSLCNNSDVNDYCGAWCNNDVLEDMLQNPSKKTAEKHYTSLIHRYFESGFGEDPFTDMPDLLDHEVYEIAKEYGIAG